MAYTTIDKPTDYFRTKLYTGNGTNDTAITWDETDTNMQPNWLWIKNRDENQSHASFDSVRGATLRLNINEAGAEGTENTNLDSFDSNGFTVDNELIVNGSSDNMVAWGWKAGTSFTNDASSTGIGTIDSTGSVNQDAGFSICSFTGNGTSGASVKHGLSTKPAMMIIKNRDEADSWQVYHHKNTSAPATETLQLNETGATSDTSNRWNDTEPTTAILTLGDNPTVNKNTIKYIGYIFSEIKGYSKFGSYTANNNSNGTFIYTGFKPAFAIFKKSSGTETWHIHDNKRSPFNVSSAELYASESQAEDTNARLDLLSNGVKMRTDGGGYNTGSETYVYMAFAKNPFVTSTGVPATAR
tara:strand:- start:12 stop:1079 length:1068 start_codon:yes stop_codon:yes gene_type:complete